MHIEVRTTTIKKRNANKTILLQLFLRDVISGQVPTEEKTICLPIYRCYIIAFNPSSDFDFILNIKFFLFIISI